MTGRQMASAGLLDDPAGYKQSVAAGIVATGAILLKSRCRRGATPLAVDGDYVIAGADVPLSTAQRPLIIADKLGASGQLPDTVGS